ncbi:MAG: hypothetical protein JNK44_10170 [Cyclobacteriaceae bacterium]|nr:hypothetical protein [Cyclobacteriaceae bacterium]
MEHSSQKNLSEYSRGLERHMRNPNGEPEHQTPSSSHQQPDRKLQGLPLKYYQGMCAVREGRVGVFLRAGAAKPLRLSIPHARNFVHV